MRNEQAHPSATGSMDMKRNIILLDNLLSMLTLTQWKAYNFSTTQHDTRVFSRFTREFKGYLRYICDTLKADIVSFEADNFKVSALVQRQDAQLVRIALDDVRRSRNFDFILLRTLPG